MNILEVRDRLGNHIVLSLERWSHSLKHKIPDLDKIEECIKDPYEIRSSKKDSEIALYYRKMNHNEFLCVVVQINAGFITTAYITDTMKKGEILWTQK